MHKKIELICNICKETFLRHKSNIIATKTGKAFCSRKCFAEFQKGWNTNPNRVYKKKQYILISCTYCKQPIYRWNYRLKQNKHQFCNNECCGKWNSLYLIAENAVNWKGGLNYLAHKILTNPRYLKIRKQILERDNYKCALCSSNCKKCHISIRGKEEDYIGFFDGIVAKRMNSGKPYRVIEGNPEPSPQSGKVQRLLEYSDILNNQISVRPERDEIVRVR